MRKNFGVKPWFYPLPVLIVATYDENGTPDAMNAAWGGLYDADMVVLCLSENHKTTANIRLNNAFTVSFATADTVVPCDYVGMVSANDVADKFTRAGFTSVKSEFVNAPLINELPLALECELAGFTENGNVIGKIKNISADEKILGYDGKIDVKQLRPISYEPVTNEYLVVSEFAGRAFSAGNKLK